jgi:hypothetical protein
VPLSRDFLLWLYRDRLHLTWRQLEAQPPWRTERDLAYLGLEALAQSWHAEQRKAQEKDRAFMDFQTRAKQKIGLVR